MRSSRLTLANELLLLSTRNVVELDAFEFTAAMKTVSEANSRDHWRKRAERAKSQRFGIHWQWYVTSGAGKLARVRLPAVVTLTRLAPRELDDDNLRSALKAVRDQVAEHMGLASDRVPEVTWLYGQEKGKPPGVRVRIVHEPKQPSIPGVA